MKGKYSTCASFKPWWCDVVDRSSHCFSMYSMCVLLCFYLCACLLFHDFQSELFSAHAAGRLVKATQHVHMFSYCCLLLDRTPTTGSDRSPLLLPVSHFCAGSSICLTYLFLNLIGSPHVFVYVRAVYEDETVQPIIVRSRWRKTVHAKTKKKRMYYSSY